MYKAFDEEEGIEVAWNQVRVNELVASREERYILKEHCICATNQALPCAHAGTLGLPDSQANDVANCLQGSLVCRDTCAEAVEAQEHHDFL